jgi:hypothetical protein
MLARLLDHGRPRGIVCENVLEDAAERAGVTGAEAQPD